MSYNHGIGSLAPLLSVQPWVNYGSSRLIPLCKMGMISSNLPYREAVKFSKIPPLKMLSARSACGHAQKRKLIVKACVPFL